MPLTKKGERILNSFKKRYKDRGEEIFYRYMNKHPKITKTWHRD